MRERARLRWGLTVAIAVIAVAMVLGGCAPKQEEAKWPQNPVKVVVGWSPGGPTDVQARVVVPLMQKYLGGSWAVSNQAGAAGSIGASEVVKAPKDGYTLLYGSETMSVWQVMDVVDLNPTRDFEPIGIGAEAIVGLSVPANSRFTSVQQLIDEAKANPGKVQVATAGPAAMAHVSGLLLEKYMGVKFTYVPFQGGGPAVMAAVGGQVDVTMEPVTNVIEHHKGGTLKILAILDNKRDSRLPDVPALGEIYPEMKPYLPYGPYFGLFAPKGIPDNVKKTLIDGITKVFADEEWKSKVDTLYLVGVNKIGDDARQYLDAWTSRASWILYDAGVAKKSPEQFGIPRPK